MHTTAWPNEVDIAPGETGFVSIAITNTSTVIDAYQVQVFGLDPEWVRIEPPRLSLFPGDTDNVSIHLDLPTDYPSSQRTLAVNVASEDDPGVFSLSNVELAVRPQTKTTVTADPVMITGGRKASFGLVVANTGNARVTATGFAIDPEDLAEFTFEPERVVVPPGHEQVIKITAQGGRSWFGQMRARTFTMGVDAEERIETIGTFIQRPRIGRWLIALLGMLTVAAVFAAVIGRTFSSVVDEAKVTDEILDAALDQGDPGGAIVPTNPGGVSGSIASASTGEGLAGVQVDLFFTDSTNVPIKTSVTDDDGAFTLSNLDGVAYKLRFSGAGIDSLWYPATDTPADAAEIAVELDETTQLDPVTVGGLPVEVSGSIDVEDTSDVELTLLVAGQLDPSVDPVVAKVALSPDGSFVLDGIPSPGDYQLIVEKPGAAIEQRDVGVDPGEGVSGINISLRPGEGIVSGSVSDPLGPLGGATITATTGTSEIQTVSLTEGAVGTFTLRNLATPAQYTITISKPGFSSETRTVALDNAQTVGNFTSRLVPATGSVNGRAILDGAATRGLSVNIAGGSVNRTIGVVSQGAAAGTYSFTGLPAPATYTLTFSGAGTIPQVRVVDLDPDSGAQNVTGIDVNLSGQSSVVRGVVRNADGDLQPGATVTLSDGTTDLTFLSANLPLGEFEFSNVLPGAYTLSASSVGTIPVVVLVNVSATSATSPLDLRLGATAAIAGRVVGANGIDDFNPASQRVDVRLFVPGQFPGTETVARVETDASGNYTFAELDAPASYIIAIYDSTTSDTPLDSQILVTEPSTTTPAVDFRVSLRVS